jgi:cation transport protein ChaC
MNEAPFPTNPATDPTTNPATDSATDSSLTVPAAVPALAPIAERVVASKATSDPLEGMERLPAQWVFAYGSLIWHPDFDYTERHLARVHGYHRAFCISSTMYRGTPESPGVVLGLDRGGSCQGVVYRLPPGQETQIVERLYRREMPNHVYTPRLLPIRLADGRSIEAITFVARRNHPSYLKISRDEVLRRLSSCRGGRGHNREYAINTWHALREWGIEDAGLGAIAHALQSLACAGEGAEVEVSSSALPPQR